jgi:hypothetical protein
MRFIIIWEEQVQHQMEFNECTNRENQADNHFIGGWTNGGATFKIQ